jgi:transcriptional regulator PpsR
VSQGIDPLKPEAELVPFRQSSLVSEIFGTSMVADLAVAAGDVTLLVDAGGVVQDIAFGEADLAHGELNQWVGRLWIDTVTVESRPKVEAMLEPGSVPKRRWRQVNQKIDGQDVPIKYLTLDAERPGWFVAIGRDLRSTAALQQRLLQTQQAMERDYIRLRQAESRYRLLFNQAAEAVLILDSASRRVTEANPAAAELIGASADSLVGRTIASLFHPDDRDRVIALLGSVAAAENVDPVDLRLARDAHDCRLAATLFRQGRGSFFLVRLASGDQGSQTQTHSHPDRRLAAILERIPDAFVVTDENLNIVTENAAFLEMTQFARKEQVRGEALGRFLGRPGIDLNLLTAQLREHGSISNFATIMRDRYDTQDDVEVSAVTVNEGQQEWIGFTIRMVGRLREQRPAGDGVTRSVEQLTELVGRVSLKEIVRESTDLIERLCIEAALTYTSDNRASAAEILGLSRQSLYSKLHRHGLANGQADADQAG